MTAEEGQCAIIVLHNFYYLYYDVNTYFDKGLIAEQFLESTASQITCHGIVCLREEIKPENLAVLFRNNHFSTIYRHKVRGSRIFAATFSSRTLCRICLKKNIVNINEKFKVIIFLYSLLLQDELFTLVTDLGFLCERNVVWETLSSVQGDSYFVDGNCLNCPPKSDTSQMPDNPNLDYVNSILSSITLDRTLLSARF